MTATLTEWGGFTLAQIEAAAQHCARHCWSQILTMEERAELAWGAIAEAVADGVRAGRTPKWNDILRAGTDAIDTEAMDWLRHNGRSNTRSFFVYWTWEAGFRWSTDPAAGVEARLALGQVLAAMRPIDRETLVALAMHGTQAAAADALGIVYGSMTRRTVNARRAFYELWFQGGQVPPLTRDRRVQSYTKPPVTHCKNGHEFTPENTYRNGKGATGLRRKGCRACAIERSRKHRLSFTASAAKFHSNGWALGPGRVVAP